MTVVKTTIKCIAKVAIRSMYYLGWDVQYPYTADLMLLNFCSPPHGYAIPELEQVSTPLHPDSWEASLAAHPDRAYVQYICQGLREGFRVGFHWDAPLASATRNMHSTSLRPAVISEYIGSELAKGRMLGPFPPSWKRHLHINRFGLIPKGHNTGKYRLITDLSHPRGSSVNDGIDPALTSLTYITVDSVMQVVRQLGKGSLLAKMDIESAYRLVPVHPQDRILQAVEWDGQIYVDPMLPFGLRSAPKIFTAVADALNWCLQRAGIRFVSHYLDDFIVVAPPRSEECQRAVEALDSVCAKLGVPWHPTSGTAPRHASFFWASRLTPLLGNCDFRKRSCRG